MRRLTIGLCLLVAGCARVPPRSPPIEPATPPVPRTVTVGQPWAAATAAAARAGFPTHDAAGLETVPAVDGFTVDLPDDRGLIVRRSPATNAVERIDWVEHWLASKAARVYHDVPAFELRPAS